MSHSFSSHAVGDHRALAFVLLAISPLLFTTNMLMAKFAAGHVAPTTLAFLRWSGVLLLVLGLSGRALWRQRRQVLREAGDLLILGGLGMGVCGAFVYIGAETTSATNIGLIYSASPAMIMVLAYLLYDEDLSLRRVLGLLLAAAGVLTIIAKGQLSSLLALDFTLGDVWILGATIGWAVYSIMLRHRSTQLDPATRFAAIVLGGVLVLAPFTAWEVVEVGWPVFDRKTIGIIVVLSLIAGFAAYQVYGIVQRLLGAGVAGMVLYLSPVYNSALAHVLLGERFESYHLVGGLLVLPGLFLASRKVKKVKTGWGRGARAPKAGV